MLVWLWHRNTDVIKKNLMGSDMNQHLKYLLKQWTPSFAWLKSINAKHITDLRQMLWNLHGPTVEPLKTFPDMHWYASSSFKKEKWMRAANTTWHTSSPHQLLQDAPPAGQSPGLVSYQEPWLRSTYRWHSEKRRVGGPRIDIPATAQAARNQNKWYCL